MSSRENILARLSEAKKSRPVNELKEPDLLSPIYHEPTGSLADWFQENLELVAGIVHRAEDLNKAAELLATLQADEKWAMTYCTDPLLQGALNGKVAYTEHEADFLNLQTGITGCEFLVAHLGSVMTSSASASGRRLHVFPETHVVIAHQQQLVKHLDDALQAMQDKYRGDLPSSITNITGPSRTADIEKTLVMGMHGPKKLIVILCEKPF